MLVNGYNLNNPNDTVEDYNVETEETVYENLMVLKVLFTSIQVHLIVWASLSLNSYWVH